MLQISQDRFDLLEEWSNMISYEDYIFRLINNHGYFGQNLHPASLSTISKALQKDSKMNPG